MGAGGKGAGKPQCVVMSGANSSPIAGAARDTLLRDAELEVARRVAALDDSVPAEFDVGLIVVPTEDVPTAAGLISRWRSERPATGVVVLGVALKLEDILMLLSAGASDFVSVPFSSDELIARAHRVLGQPTATSPEPPRVAAPRLSALVGSNPAFVNQVSRIPMVAGCDANVLIIGETGTGKEIFAQAIHYLSARASRPWVAVNCGAIPVDLIENELFGHARGAYTTAHSARSGLVLEAEGGTLFLDEIDCLPVAAQVKLLRFLQEKEFRAVGSNATVKANVRVIAATNQPLADLVSRGRFRRDLYYRLNVLTLSLPPLRERPDDILALALHFVAEFAKQNGRQVAEISPMALQKLLRHTWPGNVRELRHVIERAVLLAPGRLLCPENIELEGDGAPGDDESFQRAKARVVSSFEKCYIEHLLLVHRGNISQAARAAKKNRRAFFELMRKHRIKAVRFRPDSGTQA